MEQPLRLNLSGAFATATPSTATPKFLAPLAPPTFPFTAPTWTRPQKPRAIALLDVFKNHELLTTYTVDQKPVYLIGRNAVACDIVLNHCSVSRLHATIIHHTDGAAYLVDLGSCHGTFVDDIRLVALQPTLLVHGATLKFGASSRSYAFKTFESHEMIVERVQSRIGLAPDEVEVEQNTLLNRALSYRLGFSIPLAHHQTPDAEGDDPMAALYPMRQIEPSTSVSALIRRTQSEDSTNTGAFALTAAAPAAIANGATASGNEPGRKRSRAQSAGLPTTTTGALLPPGLSTGQPHLYEDDDEDSDGSAKRVHFCDRPVETIPPRPVYYSPERTPTPSSNVSSASSSPQISPESELPPRAVNAKVSPRDAKSACSSIATSGMSIKIELPRLSPPSAPPLLMLNRIESCSSASSNSSTSEQKKASHEVAS